jgi:predicted HD superfamily hydrolase involved in NAD metabolism
VKVERNIQSIQNWVKTQVSPRRFEHILGVAKTAKLLATRHGQSVSNALLAAWLHDCAKELPKSEMKSWLRKSHFRLDDEEKEMPVLWHPHVAASIAFNKWGVRNLGVLEGIRCHTLGHPRMGSLAQLIFVADFIEPGREFYGVDVVRLAAKKSLTNAVSMKASMTIKFLLEKKMRIHPRLLETWNSFLKLESNEKP